MFMDMHGLTLSLPARTSRRAMAMDNRQCWPTKSRGPLTVRSFASSETLRCLASRCLVTGPCSAPADHNPCTQALLSSCPVFLSPTFPDA